MIPVHPHRARRGFTVMMLLVVLVLLGVFSLVAGRLFVSTLRATRSAHDTHTRALRLDGMLRMLREDVWCAADVRQQHGRLLLSRPGQVAIEWRIDPDGTIVRGPLPPLDVPTLQWKDLGVRLSLVLNRAGVVIHLEEGPSGRADTLILINQMDWLGRKSP